MSGKNRAFALVVATAALVGVSAPVAGAATFSGPSGFNNDSILNVSGNQVPVQACNLVPITAVLGLLSPGNQASASNTSCAQNPAETNTTTTTATSSTAAPASSTSAATNSTPSDPSADTTSGFNNDSVVNVSGNQVPVQACNAALNTLAALGILSSGAISAMQETSCTQNPAETNSSSVASSN